MHTGTYTALPSWSLPSILAKSWCKCSQGRGLQAGLCREFRTQGLSWGEALSLVQAYHRPATFLPASCPGQMPLGAPAPMHSVPAGVAPTRAAILPRRCAKQHCPGRVSPSAPDYKQHPESLGSRMGKGGVGSTICMGIFKAQTSALPEEMLPSSCHVGLQRTPLRGMMAVPTDLG